MFRSLLLALPLVLIAASATADDDINCNNATTQMAMNICADKDYQAADNKLNDAYRTLTAMLDQGQKSKLVVAQRAWIAYRDKRCQSETAESEGGSMHPMLYSSCLTDMTKARTKELLADIECQKHGEKCYD